MAGGHHQGCPEPVGAEGSMICTRGSGGNRSSQPGCRRREKNRARPQGRLIRRPDPRRPRDREVRERPRDAALQPIVPPDTLEPARLPDESGVSDRAVWAASDHSLPIVVVDEHTIGLAGPLLFGGPVSQPRAAHPPVGMPHARAARSPSSSAPVCPPEVTRSSIAPRPSEAGHSPPVTQAPPTKPLITCTHPTLQSRSDKPWIVWSIEIQSNVWSTVQRSKYTV
jgi:hypothetical protein